MAAIHIRSVSKSSLQFDSKDNIAELRLPVPCKPIWPSVGVIETVEADEVRRLRDILRKRCHVHNPGAWIQSWKDCSREDKRTDMVDSEMYLYFVSLRLAPVCIDDTCIVDENIQLVSCFKEGLCCFFRLLHHLIKTNIEIQVTEHTYISDVTKI